CPTLPRGLPRSTIGAEGLSFRVRNGTGRFPPRYGRRNSMEICTLFPGPTPFFARVGAGGGCGGAGISGTVQWTRTHGDSHESPYSGRARMVIRVWCIVGVLSLWRISTGQLHESL